MHMLSSLTRNWWIAVLRGVIAIGFGAAAFIWPGVTLEILIVLFGAYAFLDGITTLLLGVFGMGAHERWWAAVLSGVVGVLVGVATFVQPATTALALIYVIAAWALVTGVLQVLAAIRLRELISGEWLLGLGGALSVLFGILLVTAPAAGVLTLVFLFGYYAISAGIAQIGFGLRLRGLAHHLPLLHRTPATSTSR
jgi:uncharacterized membrane protein HdeD (DUF308 family)